MAALKADVDVAEAEAKKEGDSIKVLSDRLAQRRKAPITNWPTKSWPNTKPICKAASCRRKKISSHRESLIYYGIYQQIFAVVDKYAKENKYKVVLKYNSEPVNAAKPEDVLRGINSPVIWHADAIDITPAIAKLLQQKVPGEPAPSAAGHIPSGSTVPAYATTSQPSYPKAPVYSTTTQPSYPTAPAYASKPAETKAPAATPPPASAKKPATPAIKDVEDDEEDEVQAAEPARQKTPSTKKTDGQPAKGEKTGDKKTSKPGTGSNFGFTVTVNGKCVFEKKIGDKNGSKKATVVAFTLKGEYPEGPIQPGLFGERQTSLATLSNAWIRRPRTRTWPPFGCASKT